MTNSKYGRLIYIATSIFIVLLGVAFIVCCAHLFFTGGDQPYTREIVGKYLLGLLAPSVVTAALVVFGFVSSKYDSSKKNDEAKRTNADILSAMAPRFELEKLDDDTKKAVAAERRKRTLLEIAAYVVSAILAALALVLILGAEFTVDNLNGDVVAALAFVLPLSAGAVAVHILKACLTEQSAEKEIQLLKDAVKAGFKPSKAENLVETEGERKTVLVVKIAVIAVGLVFILLGTLNGGMSDVLAKAVKICTECIGLG